MGRLAAELASTVVSVDTVFVTVPYIQESFIQNLTISDLKSCVKVEVAVLGSRPQ